MRKLTIATSFCLAASVFLASEARAGIIFTHGTETASRTNQGGLTYYDDIFFTNPSSFTDVELTSVTVGVRRINPAPAVGVDVYAVPMTGSDKASMSGDLSQQVLLGSFPLCHHNYRDRSSDSLLAVDNPRTEQPGHVGLRWNLDRARLHRSKRYKWQ